MKIKILIGLLLISVMLVSGCFLNDYDDSLYKTCLEGQAEKFCEERNCSIKSYCRDCTGGNKFYILTEDYREVKKIYFTLEETEECKELARGEEQ